MQIYWASQNFFFEQKKFKILIIKENFFSDFRINTKILPKSFVFSGGVLNNNDIVVWAKPGIFKEEYILFFENLQPFLKTSCNEILLWSFKCIQHALSLKNKTVVSTLKTLTSIEEITMEDFE